jgi:hypothetical protein
MSMFVRGGLAATAAVTLGILGTQMLFTDLRVNETALERLTVITLFYLLAGILLGALPLRIWWLGGLTGWGGLAYGFASWQEAANDGSLSFVSGLLILGALVAPAALVTSGAWMHRALHGPDRRRVPR